MNIKISYKYPPHLPQSLKESAIRFAKEGRLSLNQWIAAAVAQEISAVESAETFLRNRGAGAEPGGFLRLFDNAPDRPLEPGEEPIAP